MEINILPSNEKIKLSEKCFGVDYKKTLKMPNTKTNIGKYIHLSIILAFTLLHNPHCSTLLHTAPPF